MNIMSCLVSQQYNKSKSNYEQKFNSIDLMPVTFGVNPRGKKLMKS